MIYQRLKKVVISAAIAAAFILSTGFATSSATFAQYRDRDRWGDHDRRWDDRRDREEFWRIRRLDRENQVRYRWNNSTRVVGYYDRFGRFHAYGFYDRFGRFHRY
ncbi:MAG TPA: hypothetical protein VNS63_01820 [Blastocatellia bacterium]|nr:hypothetical protein [Blastocatellia bacterium]